MKFSLSIIVIAIHAAFDYQLMAAASTGGSVGIDTSSAWLQKRAFSGSSGSTRGKDVIEISSDSEYNPGSDSESLESTFTSDFVQDITQTETRGRQESERLRNQRLSKTVGKPPVVDYQSTYGSHSGRSTHEEESDENSLTDVEDEPSKPPRKTVGQLSYDNNQWKKDEPRRKAYFDALKKENRWV